MTELAAFLRQAAGERFRFGEWDCAMLLANWAQIRTGVDPAARLRGRYRTRLGWTRIVKREGGLVALVGRLAEQAGFQPAAMPAIGDIGVVELSGHGPAGAIRTAQAWALKVDDGIVSAPLPMLAAWKI